MRRPRLAAAAVVLAAALPPACGAEFALDGVRLTVPDGFVVTRAAGPPLVDRPVSVAFDERGRLYVAESSGSNEPLDVQAHDPRHKVVRLEDIDGDGAFDRRTVFADGLMMLQGTQWHRGSLYVAAPPRIWRLTDTDDDGVADERQVWLDGGGPLACGNLVHGPYLGRDGRLYWCKGEFATQTHDLPGRPGWTSSAAHVFRARPDGGLREVVMTGGMNNPVELAFTPAGERILSATFISDDPGGGRDGLIHALYGGVYGREHGVLEGHERTGDLLPPLLTMGAAAPCGTQIVESAAGLGAGHVGNLFVCAFNLRTVFRTVLTPAAGSFTAVSEPFLVGESPDFHPTDVHEDADGSLLVIDTGGWYKLCCPTSRIEKPEVRGAIYRVRRGGTARVEDPRGLALDWPRFEAPRLCGLLADPRPAVAARAGEALALSGAAAVAPLREFLATSPVAATRQRAVWTLARIDVPEARAAVREALADAAAEVRQAAAHVAGLHRDGAAVPGLAALVRGPDAGPARAAAEALGRVGTVAAVEAVLAAVPTAASRALEHSLTYALIESAEPGPLLAALEATDPRVVRAALWGLDQMASRLPAPVLPRDRGLELCRASDPVVRDAAWWIASRHPDWADGLADGLAGQLERATAAGPDERDRVVASLARLAGRPPVAEAVAAACTGGGAPVRSAALAVMRAAGVRRTPPSWVDAIGAVVAAGPAADDATAALETAAGLPLSAEQRAALRPAVLAVAEAANAPPRCRASAARILAADVPAELVARLIDVLDADAAASPLDRAAAATALAGVRLDDAQLARIAATLPRLLGSDAAVLLPAFTRRAGGPLAAALEAIGRGPAPHAIDRAVVAAAVAALPEEHAAMGVALLRRIDAARAAERESFRRLAEGLPAGDAARGAAVFASAKAACTACHAVGGAGGRIGPDLTRVGAIRTPRDLLEAIVLPSASFVRTYEPVTIVTGDGRASSGIIRDETATDVVLQTGATATERIARASIESLRPGAVSLMPQGYDALLSPQELADLVAYLAATR